jgi:hypothetical protein
MYILQNVAGQIDLTKLVRGWKVKLELRTDSLSGKHFKLKNASTFYPICMLPIPAVVKLVVQLLKRIVWVKLAPTIRNTAIRASRYWEIHLSLQSL